MQYRLLGSKHYDDLEGTIETACDADWHTRWTRRFGLDSYTCRSSVYITPEGELVVVGIPKKED